MDAQNQNRIWRELDESYMDLKEWLPFIEKLLENGQIRLSTQVVFGDLTIRELISRIKKDVVEYKKLLKKVKVKKEDKKFSKAVPQILLSIKALERRVSNESI